MAYYNSQDEENEENSAQGMNQTQDSTQPVQLSSQTSTVSGGSAAPKAVKSASSGSGPSFSNYTKANQGLAQDKLNSAVAQNVTNAGQTASRAINQASNQFSKQVDSGSLANRENAVSDVKGVLGAARNLTAPASNATNAPNGNGGFVPPQAGPAVEQTGTPNLNKTAANIPLDQAQKDRFAQVINAQYQGPESLRQSGLYQLASGRVQNAQNAIKNTENSVGREELLRNMYQQKGNYTSGLNKLDSALLNASQQGVKNLQNAAKAQGDVGQKLDQAQISSSTLSQNRAKEIQNIQEQARAEFTAQKAAEEAATEERLSKVVANWENLPNYFKDIIRNKEANNTQILNDAITGFKTEKNYDALAADLAQKQAAAKALDSSFKSKFRDEFNNPFSVNDIGYSYTPKEWDYTYSKESYLKKLASEAERKNGGYLNPEAYSQLEAQAAKEYNDLQAQIAAAGKAYETANQQKLALDSEMDSMRNKFNDNAIILNPFEAGVLGVEGGEGLYNMGEDAIKVRAAEKDRLISRDEQLRQAALSALAGLDQSNRLSTTLRYDNAEKAGTQSALDALDLEGIRNALNESEQGFRDSAKNANITGQGHKKVSRGNAWGKKTRNYYATVDGNVGDMLEQAGYDLDAPIGNGQDTVTGRQLLQSALNATNTQRLGNADRDDANATLAGSAAGGATGAGIGFQAGGPVGAAIGGIGGAVAGGALASGTVDPYQMYSDIVNGYIPGAGKTIQDVRSGIGNVAGTITSPFGNTISKGISGAIGGINTSAMKAMGEAVAKEEAIKDLQRQYRSFLEGQGFENRVAVANEDAVKGRLNALSQLLANLDKTNT